MRIAILYISVVFLLIIGLTLLASSLDRNEFSSMPGFSDSGQKSESDINLNFFERQEKEDEYELTYGWKDFMSNPYCLTFPISKQQLSLSEREFGYYPEDLKKYVDEHIEKMKEEMIVYLKEFVTREIAKSKYPQYISIRNITLKSFGLKLSASPSHYKEAKSEFKKITDKLAKEQKAYLKKIEKEQKKRSKIFLEEKSLRVIGKRIAVDYAQCVENNRSRVKHIVKSMREIKKNFSIYQFLELMLAFIQEIKFGIPSLEENNKRILGFWVPLKVLANNFGDCDSKGVTFASMWINFRRYPILLIEIPEHLFVALAIPSIRGEGITIKGLRCTLCEVTGPEKMPPGLITPYSQFYLKGGQFNYVYVR
ncbi:MAG: hypothetical protein JSV96_01115 [Candidatus Aminicenantes bacterium]|nr:MAG: hypothetical protein JSV96_01115 [Candidatus Aminicenantes bacterium]